MIIPTTFGKDFENELKDEMAQVSRRKKELREQNTILEKKKEFELLQK